MRLIFLDAGPLGLVSNPRGNCILAATAILATSPGVLVTVATDNVGHLTRFLDARDWSAIAP